MNAEKLQQETAPRVTQQKRQGGALCLEDNRNFAVSQAKMVEAIQRQGDDEEELLQGKFTTQLQSDEEELMQGKFAPVQRQAENQTGIPDPVKQRMEDSFNTDFSSVRVHPDSAKAPEVGALAYTQGTDIHFAPGQFKPDTSAGQQLLGHELTHVIQQQEGRVQPTTEIGGMAVNDNPALEHEADARGAQVVQGKFRAVVQRMRVFRASNGANGLLPRVKYTDTAKPIPHSGATPDIVARAGAWTVPVNNGGLSTYDSIAHLEQQKLTGTIYGVDTAGTAGTAGIVADPDNVKPGHVTLLPATPDLATYVNSVQNLPWATTNRVGTKIMSPAVPPQPISVDYAGGVDALGAPLANTSIPIP